METSSLTRERAVAMEAVSLACQLCEAVRADLVSTETLAKRDRSPVTVADFGAQALVSHLLLSRLGNPRIVGEEDAADLAGPEMTALRDRIVGHVRRWLPELNLERILEALDRGRDAGGANGRFWTLDPIDGTKGFLRGEQYAVALALIEEGQVVLGVLGCPNMPLRADAPRGPRGCLFVALRGGGAWMYPLAEGAGQATPIGVDGIADPAEARFCESVESGHSSHDHAAATARRLGVTAAPQRMDSQAKYAAVARGEASIYLRLPTSEDYREKIWDHAAGFLLVHEAGGRATDIEGRPLAFSLGRTLAGNRGIVATNGRLHDRVLEAVRDTLGL